MAKFVTVEKLPCEIDIVIKEMDQISSTGKVTNPPGNIPGHGLITAINAEGKEDVFYVKRVHKITRGLEYKSNYSDHPSFWSASNLSTPDNPNAALPPEDEVPYFDWTYVIDKYGTASYANRYSDTAMVRCVNLTDTKP